jgi:uncharacterized protein
MADDSDHRFAPGSEAWRKLLTILGAHFDKHEVPDHHGLKHAISVVNNATKAAVAHEPKLTRKQHEEVCLAALLHDAGDRKYFGGDDPGYTDDGRHARALLEAVEVGKDTIERVIEMIGLVSFHKNGNDTVGADGAKIEPWMLIPRWADRLESIGVEGADRCASYSAEHGRPQLPTDDEYVPPVTMEEFLARATPERLARYRRTGTSVSTLDHFWEKLMHIPAGVIASGNAFLVAQAKERAQLLYGAGFALATEGVEAFWAVARP